MNEWEQTIPKIARRSLSSGITWSQVREGGSHTVDDLDGVMIPIPRHREIGEHLTEKIYRETETKLGRDWWRK